MKAVNVRPRRRGANAAEHNDSAAAEATIRSGKGGAIGLPSRNGASIEALWALKVSHSVHGIRGAILKQVTGSGQALDDAEEWVWV